jgi:hypothetical protein
VIFEDANVHVRSGAGATDSTVNGRGNLIIGYNEARDGYILDRGGSNNLVLGSRNEFSSYGGMVVGRYNSIEAPYSSVSAGWGNTASGGYSSVSGGQNNTASGMNSSVSAGISNTASGDNSSVSGGYNNTAGGLSSSVSGGSWGAAWYTDDWRGGFLFWSDF